jgi:hypothetical protein
MKKINVVISNINKHAVTDWNARAWYLSLNDGDTAYVATSTMLNELRLGVRNKELETFTFHFNDDVVSCGEKGHLDKWPCDFMDHQAIHVKALMKGISYEQSKNALHETRDK